jgi:hypothetical protein
MAYKEWTPRIVGGTDMDGVPLVVEAPSMSVQVSDEDGLIMTTHDELSDYAKSIETIPEGAKGYIDPDDVSWVYGPIQRREDVRGQYVVEKHNGKEHQLYWIPC